MPTKHSIQLHLEDEPKQDILRRMVKKKKKKKKKKKCSRENLMDVRLCCALCFVLEDF